MRLWQTKVRIHCNFWLGFKTLGCRNPDHRKNSVPQSKTDSVHQDISHSFTHIHMRYGKTRHRLEAQRCIKLSLQLLLWRRTADQQPAWQLHSPSTCLLSVTQETYVQYMCVCLRLCVLRLLIKLPESGWDTSIISLYLLSSLSPSLPLSVPLMTLWSAFPVHPSLHLLHTINPWHTFTTHCLWLFTLRFFKLVLLKWGLHDNSQMCTQLHQCIVQWITFFPW